MDGLSKDTSWTWKDVLVKYPREEGGQYPGAAPVEAFKHQKVPLSPYWDNISVIGTVGEVELDADLHNYLSSKKKKSNRDNGVGKQEAVKKQYWFVQVLQIEGYLLKVGFIGFHPNLAKTVKDCERWIHYLQLKEIGYHKNAKTHECAIPQIPEFMAENMKEILNRLYHQISGKFTVHPLLSEWMKQEEESVRWKIGTQVKVRNRDCCTEMIRGFVVKTIGKRVKISYRGAAKREPTWVHEDDSELVKPINVGEAKLSPLVKVDDPLSPMKSTELELKVVAQMDSKFDIKEGMLFEFINPIKLDVIAVGKVTKVLEEGYFNCKIESEVLELDLETHTKGRNEFRYHIGSDQLFPLGTFVGETPSPRPADAAKDKEFKWDEYLKRKGLEALPLLSKSALLQENACPDFKELMWMEVVDSHSPELVCPAVIMKVVHPYAIRVRFLGYEAIFDQWKPLNSLEIFPVGWCHLVDYPLLDPGSEPFNLPAFVKKAQVESSEATTVSAEKKSNRSKLESQDKTVDGLFVLSQEAFGGGISESEASHGISENELIQKDDTKPEQQKTAATKLLKRRARGTKAAGTGRTGSKSKKGKKSPATRDNSADAESELESTQGIGSSLGSGDNPSSSQCGRATRRSARSRAPTQFFGDNVAHSVD